MIRNCDHCNKEVDVSITSATFWCKECYVRDHSLLVEKGISEASTDPNGHPSDWVWWSSNEPHEKLKQIPKLNQVAEKVAEDKAAIACDHCDKNLGTEPLDGGGEPCIIHWCDDCWKEDKSLRDASGVKGSGCEGIGVHGWMSVGNVSKLRAIPKKTAAPKVEAVQPKEILCDHCNKVIAGKRGTEYILHWCDECDTQDRKLWEAAVGSHMSGSSFNGARSWTMPSNAEKLRAIPKRVIDSTPEQTETTPCDPLSGISCCDHCGVALNNTDLPTDYNGLPLTVFWCETCYAEDQAKLPTSGYRRNGKGAAGWINMEKTVRAFPKKAIVAPSLPKHQADCDPLSGISCCDHCGKTIDVSSPVFDARTGGREGCIYWCSDCTNETKGFLWSYLISNDGLKYKTTVDAEGNRQFKNSIPLMRDIPKKPKELHAPCDHCGKDLDVSKKHESEGKEYQLYWCASCVSDDRALLWDNDIPDHMGLHAPPDKSYRGYIESAPKAAKLPKKVIEGVSYLNCADCGVQTLSQAPATLALCKSCGEKHRVALLTADVPYYPDYRPEWCHSRNIEKVQAIVAAAKAEKEKALAIKTPKEETIETPIVIAEEIKTCRCDHCDKQLPVDRIYHSQTPGDPLVWCRECVSQNRTELNDLIGGGLSENIYDVTGYLGEDWRGPANVDALKTIPKICYCDHCGKSLLRDKLWDKFDGNERSTENYAWCRECSVEQTNNPFEQQPKRDGHSIFFLADSLYKSGGYVGERFRLNEIEALKAFPKKKLNATNELEIGVIEQEVKAAAGKIEAPKEEMLACLHCDKHLPKSTIKTWNDTKPDHMWCKECIQQDAKALSDHNVGHMVQAYLDDPPRFLGETFTSDEVNRLKKTFPEDFQEKEKLIPPPQETPKAHVIDPNASSAGCVCDHCGKGLLKEKVWTGAIRDYDTVWCRECVEEEKEELTKQKVACLDYQSWANEGKIFEGETFHGDRKAKIKAWPKRVIQKKEESVKVEKEITVSCDHCGASFPKKNSYHSSGIHANDTIFWCKACVLENNETLVLSNAGHVPTSYYNAHPELLGEGWNNTYDAASKIKAIPKKVALCTCAQCGKSIPKDKISTVDGEDFSYVWCRECVIKEEAFLTANNIPHHRETYQTTPPEHLGETFSAANQAKAKLALEKRAQEAAAHIACDHCGADLLREQLYFGDKAVIAWCRDCVLTDRKELIKTGMPVLTEQYYQTSANVVGEGWSASNDVSKIDTLRALPKKKIIPLCQCNHCGKSINRGKIDGQSFDYFWCRGCVEENRKTLTGTIRSLTPEENADKYEGEGFNENEAAILRAFPKKTEMKQDEVLTWNGRTWEATPVPKVEPVKTHCECDHCGKSLLIEKVYGKTDALKYIAWCKECALEHRDTLKELAVSLSPTSYEQGKYVGETYYSGSLSVPHHPIIKAFPKKSEMKPGEKLVWRDSKWVPDEATKVEETRTLPYATCDCCICGKQTKDWGSSFYNTCSECSIKVGKELGQDATHFAAEGERWFRESNDRKQAITKLTQEHLAAKKEYLQAQIKAKGWFLPLTRALQQKRATPVPPNKAVDGKTTCCICNISCNRYVNADFSACSDCAIKIHDAYDNGQISSFYGQFGMANVFAQGDGFTSALHKAAIDEVKAAFGKVESNTGHRYSDCGNTHCKDQIRHIFKERSFKKPIAPSNSTATKPLVDEIITSYKNDSPSLEILLLQLEQQWENLEQVDLDKMAQVFHPRKAPQADKLKLAQRLIDLLKDRAYLYGDALRDLSSFQDFDRLDLFFPRHDPDNYGVFDANKGVLDPAINFLQEQGLSCQMEGSSSYAKYDNDTLQTRRYKITDPDTDHSITVNLTRTTSETTSAERDHPFIALTLEVDSLFFDKKTGNIQAHGYDTQKVFEQIGRKQYLPLSPNLQAALSTTAKQVLDNKIKTLTEKGYTPTTNMSIDKSTLKVGDQISITITNPGDGATATRKATVFRTDGGLFKSILNIEVSGSFGQSWELTSTQDIEAATKLGLTPGKAKLGWAIDDNTRVDTVIDQVAPPVVVVKHADLQVGDKVALQYGTEPNAYIGEGVILVAGNNPLVASPANGYFRHQTSGNTLHIYDNRLTAAQQEIAKQYGLDVETHRTYPLDDIVKATALLAKLEPVPVDLENVSLGDKVEVEIDLKDYRFDKTKSEKVIKTAWVVGQASSARYLALETGLHPADGASNPCFHIGDYGEYAIEARRLGINYNQERVGWSTAKSGTKIRKILQKAPPPIDPKTVEVGKRYEVEYRLGYQGTAVCIEKSANGNPTWAFEKPLFANLSLPSAAQKALYQKYGITPVNTYTCWNHDALCKIRKEIGTAPVHHMHKDLVPGDVIEVEVISGGKPYQTNAIVVEMVGSSPVLATEKVIPGGNSPVGGAYANAAIKAGWNPATCGYWNLQENYDKVLTKQMNAIKLNTVSYAECKTGDLIDLELIIGEIKLRTEALVVSNSSNALTVVFRNRSDIASNCNGVVKATAERYGFETEGTAYNINSTTAVIHKHLGKANLKAVYPSTLKAGDRVEVFTSGNEAIAIAVVLQSADESAFGEPLIAFEAAHPNGWVLMDQKYQELANKYGLPAGAKIGRRVDGSTTFITKVLGRKGISSSNVKPGDRICLELDQAYKSSTPLSKEATVIASGGGTVCVVLDEVYYDHRASNLNGSQFPTPNTRDQAAKVGITLADNDCRVFTFSTGPGAAVIITDVNPGADKEDDEEEDEEVDVPINPNSLQTGDQVVLEISGIENEPIRIDAVALGVDYNGFPLVFLEDEIKKALVFEQVQNRKACEALGFDPKERRGWEINPAKTKILEILPKKYEIEAEELKIGDRILVEIEEGGAFTKEGIYVGLDNSSGLPTVYFNEPIEIDGEVASWAVDTNTVPYLAALKLGLYTDQDRYLNLDYCVAIRKIIARASSPLDQDALEVEAESLQPDEEDEIEEEEIEDVFEDNEDNEEEEEEEEEEENEADENETIAAKSLSVGDQIEVKIESVDEATGEGSGKYEVRKATVVNTTWGSMPIVALEKAGFKKGTAEADTVCKLRDYGDEVVQEAKRLKISPDRKVAWSIDDMTSIVRVLSKAATDTKPQNKEEDTMPIDENGDEQGVMDTIKSDFADATARVASVQLVKGVKAGIVAAMRAKGADGGKVQAVAEMLESEFGTAFISLALGWGLPQIPMEMLSDPRVVMLCKEFRINGMATVGNEVIGMAMEYIMPAITAALSNLPAASDVVSKITAPSSKKGRKRVATTKTPELETAVSEHSAPNGKSNGVISPG
jgi:hypothetical protein